MATAFPQDLRCQQPTATKGMPSTYVKRVADCRPRHSMPRHGMSCTEAAVMTWSQVCTRWIISSRYVSRFGNQPIPSFHPHSNSWFVH